jgi:hypothetical protein
MIQGNKKEETMTSLLVRWVKGAQMVRKREGERVIH